MQAIGLLGLMLIARKPARKVRALVLPSLLVVALLFTIACGGTGIVKVPQQGTPPGTYNITVTGTAGNLQHSLPVTLVVQ